MMCLSCVYMDVDGMARNKKNDKICSAESSCVPESIKKRTFKALFSLLRGDLVRGSNFLLRCTAASELHLLTRHSWEMGE